ncbi:hypothetical protein G7Y89_g4226 [Cudoniella acicularis]|uniref:Protein kinase domain-containing protein n=1 Tax=Cudoniella acicularis TaxID=354080 RepID=A0A8H4RRA4_9HELO|nr:hypothetical protein G7Y89_g4226 [Cudoniella acicularis]
MITKSLLLLPVLRDFGLRLAMRPDEDIKIMAKDAAMYLTHSPPPPLLPPFRFLGLPKEIQFHILGYASVVPVFEITCTQRQIRYWTSCRTGGAIAASPFAMFLVSREFRDCAMEGFYGQNTFCVAMEEPLFECQDSAAQAETVESLSEISIVPGLAPFPQSSISHLTSLNLLFGYSDLKHLQPDRAGWHNWLKTIDVLSREANLEALTLQLRMSERFYPDFDDPKPTFEPEYKSFMRQTYENLVQPMKVLHKLKNFFVHLNWHTSSGFPDGRGGIEQILERMVMGQEYDAWKCGKTLHYEGRWQMLGNPEWSKIRQPSLTQKFKPASALVSHIHDFHKGVWLHKGICAYNIIWFPKPSENVMESLSSPYFIGLNHSFGQEFDYYSVGLVLIEIAMWKPLKTISEKISGSPEQLLQQLLKTHVSLVKTYMGDRYAKAVEECLTCYTGDHITAENVRLEFANKVMGPLSECSEKDDGTEAMVTMYIPHKLTEQVLRFGGLILEAGKAGLGNGRREIPAKWGFQHSATVGTAAKRGSADPEPKHHLKFISRFAVFYASHEAKPPPLVGFSTSTRDISLSRVMKSDPLSRMLDSRQQLLPASAKAKRIFDASLIKVENLSLGLQELEPLEDLHMTSVPQLEDCLKYTTVSTFWIAHLRGYSYSRERVSRPNSGNSSTAPRRQKQNSIPQITLRYIFYSSQKRAQIGEIKTTLTAQDKKVLYSKVGASHKQDYPTTFNDTQELEVIRRKLAKASLISKSNAEVGRAWEHAIQELRTEIETPYFQRLDLAGIREYISGLEHHHSVVEYLLDRLNETRTLVRIPPKKHFSFLHSHQLKTRRLLTCHINTAFQILEYRNVELSIGTNKEIQYNGHKLTSLMEHAAAETQSMTTLTDEIQRDSKSVKTLTLITVLYAPASLMASIFSSNLIRLVGNASSSDNTTMHMALASDFWKFPLLTLLLIIATIVPTLRGSNIWYNCQQRLAKTFAGCGV